MPPGLVPVAVLLAYSCAVRKSLPMGSVREIARQSGMSMATVSRVLNGADNVRPETRAKILALVEKNQYTPNRLVQGVIGGRTATIAYIGNVDSEISGRQLGAITDELLDLNHATIVLNSHNDPARELACIRCAAGFRVGAVLISPVLEESGGGSLRELRKLKIPTLASTDEPPGRGIPFIHSSDYALVVEAVKCHVEWGHRQFAYLAGPKESIPRMRRSAAFRDALKESRLKLPGRRIVSTDWFPKDAAEKAAVLLEEDPELTVLFCATDRIGAGAIVGARRAGRVPGKDISIFGMGNLDVSRVTDPELTTIGHNHGEWGKLAAKALVELAAHAGKRQRKLEYQVPGRIFWRASTCAPKRSA